MQRILLFDWTVGGHHAAYASRWCEALADRFRVVAAVPEPMVESVGEHADDVVSLGAPRPPLEPGAGARRQQTEQADRELDLLFDVAGRTGPAQIVHLYSDPILRRLVRRRPLPAPTTVCVFFSRAHYPSCFGSRLTLPERLRALYLERLVAQWRARPDAHAALALDPVAVERWNGSQGAPAFWLPEPPVTQGASSRRAGIRRRGALLYGVLSRHKGIDRLVSALEHRPGVQVVVAGPVAPEFRGEFAGIAGRLGALDPPAELRIREYDESEGIGLLRAARCAVLPYPRHFTVSRVLLEAAVAGTPVIAHDFGLLAHLVRTHGLGAVVDTGDPAQLAAALHSFTRDDEQRRAHEGRLARFAALFTRERFREHLLDIWAESPRPSSPDRVAAPLRATVT